MLDRLEIITPKRDRRRPEGWEGFFPYYAGFSEGFARTIIETVQLPDDALILDPWNGSGTTTFAAAEKGHAAIGYDINPVMIAIAKARMLPPSETDSLEPLAKLIVRGASRPSPINAIEPLTVWFDPGTAKVIRQLERSLRRRLVGKFTLTDNGPKLEFMSSMAAAHYTALFSVSRALAAPLRTSNPTWIKAPKNPDDRISRDRHDIYGMYLDSIKAMAECLAARRQPCSKTRPFVDIRLLDSTCPNTKETTADLVLTSPPYCTRIDYTAATRLELAIMSELISLDVGTLSRAMIGSVRVPAKDVEVKATWGKTCADFLNEVRAHSSKASASYYSKTLVDYFDKLDRSLSGISRSLKKSGAAIFVVQDSFYKEIHNDLPRIAVEMAENHGLHLQRRMDFYDRRSMSGIHRYSKLYPRRQGAIESVLCLSRN